MDEKDHGMQDVITDTTQVTELSEVDRLRLQLLNKNLDWFTSQSELFRLRAMEATQLLAIYSNDLAKRYGLVDPRQVDVGTGKINRRFQSGGTDE
jgi:hypothetical protein